MSWAVDVVPTVVLSVPCCTNSCPEWLSWAVHDVPTVVLSVLCCWQKQENVRVIMLSLEHAASGTNLVEATHVILIDPVADTTERAVAIESQAIGRAHRMGQDKKVRASLASWLGLAWLGLAWLGLAWLGLAWLGLAWLGLAWLGLAWLANWLHGAARQLMPWHS